MCTYDVHELAQSCFKRTVCQVENIFLVIVKCLFLDFIYLFIYVLLPNGISVDYPVISCILGLVFRKSE